MADEKLPIKFFAPREVDDLRVEGSGSSDTPNWVLEGDELAQRASKLNLAFGQFSKAVIERAERKSAVPFVFVAKMCDDATAKSRRGDISALFQAGEKSSVIGLADSDELIVKIDSVAQMNEISSRLQDYNRNSYALSCLETFWEFQPAVETEKDESTYKIKLIDFKTTKLIFLCSVCLSGHWFLAKLPTKVELYKPVPYIQNSNGTASHSRWSLRR